MFGKYLNTQHGRLPVRSIRNFAMHNSDPKRTWTIIIAQLHTGPFRIFSLPGKMDDIRVFIGIEKEIPFHDMVLRDPNTAYRPLLQSLAGKLRLGKEPSDLEYYALGDGLLGEGVDHERLDDTAFTDQDGPGDDEDYEDTRSKVSF